MRLTYEIPAENLPELTKKMESLQKRVAKLVAKGFKLDGEMVGLKVLDKGVVKPAPGEDPEHPTKFVSYRMVEVVGDTPKVSGWEFIATLQHEDGGTILRPLPTAEVQDRELDPFRNSSPVCDHCGFNRRRNNTYVVRNVDTGEFKQVGSTCLGDFLGTGQNPHMIATYAELLVAVQRMVEAAKEFKGAVSMRTLVPFEEFLAASVHVAHEQGGFVSKGEAWRSNGRKTATATIVWRGMFTSDTKDSRFIPVNEEDVRWAQKILAWAEARLSDDSALNDYEHNLRVVVYSGYVDASTAGIGASLLGYYKKERQVKQDQNTHSEHFGTVGKRTSFVLTVKSVKEFDSQYGVSKLVTFNDPKGNVAIWWTTTNTFKNSDAGKTYIVKATIKDHTVWGQHNLHQTVLTRVSVEGGVELPKGEASEPVEEAPKPSVAAPAVKRSRPWERRYFRAPNVNVVEPAPIEEENGTRRAEEQGRAA